MSPEHCVAGSDPKLVGDPVDTLSGAVVDRMLDFRLTGPIELRWWRHYDSSQCGVRFALGWGFTHEYDRWLKLEALSVTFEEPIGRCTSFPRLWSVGDRCSRGGLTLTRVGSSRYTVQRHAEPTMEFEFRGPQRSARLRRLSDGPHEILFIYDEQGRLKSIFDSVGRQIVVSESDDGSLLDLVLQRSPTSEPMLLVAYSYDAQGNLAATRNAAGHGYSFRYDGAHRMVHRRGRKGFQFHFSYDEVGRCKVAAGDGRLYGVALDYRVPGRLTTVTRPDLGVWSYSFSTAGHLLEVRDPLQGRQRYIRDAAGRLTLEVDPNGNVSTYQHDFAGQPTARIGPLGHAETMPPDPNAPDPLQHRLPASAAEYEFGRLLEVDKIQLPLRQHLTTANLSAAVRSMVATASSPDSPANHEPAFTTKPLGTLWWPAPECGRIFSDLGKLTEQVDPHGNRRRWSYDASGNLEQYVDFDGSLWTFDHGAWHLLQSVQDPLGGTVRFSHTTNGDIATFEDAGGSRSEYRYDLKDHLIEVWRHGTIRESYTRDATGNMVAKRGADGRALLQLTIGPGNLVERRALSSGDVHEFTYDGTGSMLSADTLRDKVRLSYDGFGNRSAEKRNGHGAVLEFAGLHALARVTCFDRFVCQHIRRADASLTIIDPGGTSHDVRSMAFGLVERHLGNGSIETIQYDGLGRCQFKRTEGAGATPWNRRFHWSGEGELRAVEDNILGDIQIGYDSAHRLKARRIAGRNEEYLFDAAGNLLRQPGLSGARFAQGNRLVEANGEHFEFNDRNHVRSRSSPTGTTHYHYDSRDQLIRLELPVGEWTAEYDALGRRSRKRWLGRTTEYYWSGDQLIAEVNASKGLRLYVYVDDLAQTPFLLLDYESLDADPESCRRYYVFSDHLGTPCLIQDDQRTPVWTARLAPFGVADITARDGFEFHLRQPGQYFDAESGLHYNRFRYYDPTLGRYLQSDPWGITGGYNLYAYPANPLLQCDLRGLGDESGSKKKKGDDDCEDNKALHERKGWVDEYGEQKKVTGDGSVDRDHQPSKAAIKRAAADEIDRRVAAGEMKKPTEAQKKEINRRIDAEAKSVVVDKEVHKEGPTHGHKNDETRIAEDSKDLGKAAKRDANAMVKNSKELDPDNTPHYKEAAKEIKQQTHESIMSGVNNIIDDVMDP